MLPYRVSTEIDSIMITISLLMLYATLVPFEAQESGALALQSCQNALEIQQKIPKNSRILSISSFKAEKPLLPEIKSLVPFIDVVPPLGNVDCVIGFKIQNGDEVIEKEERLSCPIFGEWDTEDDDSNMQSTPMLVIRTKINPNGIIATKKEWGSAKYLGEPKPVRKIKKDYYTIKRSGIEHYQASVFSFVHPFTGKSKESTVISVHPFPSETEGTCVYLKAVSPNVILPENLYEKRFTAVTECPIRETIESFDMVRCIVADGSGRLWIPNFKLVTLDNPIEDLSVTLLVGLGKSVNNISYFRNGVYGTENFQKLGVYQLVGSTYDDTDKVRKEDWDFHESFSDQKTACTLTCQGSNTACVRTVVKVGKSVFSDEALKTRLVTDVNIMASQNKPRSFELISGALLDTWQDVENFSVLMTEANLVSHKFLSDIFQRVPKTLRSLRVFASRSNPVAASHAYMKNILSDFFKRSEAFPHLEILKINNGHAGHPCFPPAFSYKGLTELDLNAFQLTDEEGEIIGKSFSAMNLLEKITLSNNEALAVKTANTLKNLEFLRRLRVLNLMNTGFHENSTKMILQALADKRGLEELSLHNLSDNNADDLIAILPTLTRLKVLKGSGSAFNTRLEDVYAALTYPEKMHEVFV